MCAIISVLGMSEVVGIRSERGMQKYKSALIPRSHRSPYPSAERSGTVTHGTTVRQPVMDRGRAKANPSGITIINTLPIRHVIVCVPPYPPHYVNRHSRAPVPTRLTSLYQKSQSNTIHPWQSPLPHPLNPR